MNLKEDNKKIYPKVLRGAGGGGSSCSPAPPPDPHTPVEAPEGIFKAGVAGKALSRTETEVTDLISEGPIEGLVSGKYVYAGQTNRIGWSSYVFNKYNSKENNPYLRSIFWKNVPLIDDAGNYNYSQINFRYDNGNQTSAISLTSNLKNATSAADIPQASRTLTLGDTLRYGADFAKNYDFKSTNISELIVSLKITALFDQQNDPNRDRITYDLGCGQTVKISQTAGDIRDRSITYRFKVFKITSGGYIEIPSLQRDEQTNGKISSGVIDAFKFDLTGKYDPNDLSFLGWRIQIQRTSKESTVLNLKDSVTVDSITEVFREDYIYPKSAIFKSLFTSEYFQSVPDRSYDVKLLKMKIPSNYDPIKKTYNGDWDGRFSDEYHPSGVGLYWTDNPAWCYYDLLTNKRYGLGKYIKNQQVDKWNLYQIAQYCDTIVDDGFGGLEPRFTCNTIINDFSDAFNLLNDMASIFRGMSYYANGSIFAIADMPKDPYVLFTNSNVENGDFNYSSSSKKTRNTVAVVRYNDMNYFAKPTVEHIEDPDGIRKYGIRKLEITAFGCTSRGQAYRLGRWALASEQLETETVDFTAGLDSVYLRPGDVVKIQDSNRMINRLGGRVLGITTGIGGKHKFILDEEFNNISGYFTTNFPGQTYKFEILTPTSRATGTNYSDFITGYERSKIQSGLFQMNSSFVIKATGYDPEKTLTEINCNKVFNATDYNLHTGAIWTAQTTGSGFGLNTETELYRIIGISEIEPFKYNINAMEYNPTKYLYVESGVSFADAPVLNPPASKEASYPSGLLLYETADLFLNYKISGAINTIDNQTSYWRIYAKSGSDFISNDLQAQYANIQGTIVNLPKEEFFINSLQVPDDNTPVSGEYVPSGNNQTYYFRIYGISPKGYYSRDYRAGNFYYSSNLLGDYTNLIEFNDFKYRSSYDDLTTIPIVGENAGQFVSVDLNTGNLIHDKTLNLQWSIDNLAPILKIWTNDELTYRLRFGTGNFDGSGVNSENYIYTENYSPSAASAEFSVFTGLSDINLRSYLRDDVISGFWIAIDARETDGGVKYTSQQTLAGAAYNQPHGYLFGLFQNDQMTSEKYDINTATALINSDNNISITLKDPKSYIGSIYVFFTDQIAATGYLTPGNLNKIMYQQFTSPNYTSFVKALANSGIQLREAFFNGVDTFTTSSSFFKSVGNGILQSGYMALRPSTKFEDNLMDQYDQDFTNGNAYDLGNYQRNVFYTRCANGILAGCEPCPPTFPPSPCPVCTAGATFEIEGGGGFGGGDKLCYNVSYSTVDAVPVDYESLPAGLAATYRFPRVNNQGTAVDTDRQIVNNLVFLPQTNDTPISISNNLRNLVDDAKLSGVSGYIIGLINQLSGDAFLKNQINSGDLKLASGYYLNLSGTGGRLIFNSDQVLNATTRTYAPSGYFRLDINGTGVRIPYFKSQ
jgi:hypothetical protein